MSSTKNEAKELLEQVKRLEGKISALESKKEEKIRPNKIKAFIKKYKLIILISLILLISFGSWEAYSIHSYRNFVQAANIAQTQNDFQKAEENLLGAEKVTKRSPILFVFRSKNVERMIANNQDLEILYEEQIASVDEEEVEIEEKEVEIEEEHEVIAPRPTPKTTNPKTTPPPAPTYLCTDGEIALLKSTITQNNYEIDENLQYAEDLLYLFYYPKYYECVNRPTGCSTEEVQQILEEHNNTPIVKENVEETRALNAENAEAQERLDYCLSDR